MMDAVPVKRLVLLSRDPALARVLDFWLRYAGYDTTLLEADTTRIDQVARIRPDLILLEYDADGQGPALLRQLRATPGLRQTPILAIAAADTPARQPADAPLANGWLAKPIDFGELSIWLVRLLGSPLRRFVQR